MADPAGQPIRGLALVFGGKLLEFISQSLIKGDYDFSLCIMTNAMGGATKKHCLWIILYLS